MSSRNTVFDKKNEWSPYGILHGPLFPLAFLWSLKQKTSLRTGSPVKFSKAEIGSETIRAKPAERGLGLSPLLSPTSLYFLPFFSFLPLPDWLERQATLAKAKEEIEKLDFSRTRSAESQKRVWATVSRQSFCSCFKLVMWGNSFKEFLTDSWVKVFGLCAQTYAIFVCRSNLCK